MPATLLWGLVSASMYAKPWLMMVLAALVMAGAGLLQFIVSTQPAAAPPLHDLSEKIKNRVAGLDQRRSVDGRCVAGVRTA